MKKKIFLILLVILAGVGFYYYQTYQKKGLEKSNFEIVTLDTGTVVQEVTASGTIEPINTISVGTQVSGIVEKVLVDYNDEVTQGQLLATLDTAVLTENMNDAKARLELAKAKQKITKLNYTRYKKLYTDKLIAKATFEDAEVALAEDDANVLIATAAYNKAKQNFDYASITSPVAGTVISKEVEQGQTVASTLQTPTLFTIAQDLSQMQIEANIAEADIGSIKKGMDVTFSVDAYPSETFKGIVQQIRLSPIEESNVVMYTVVITVDNSSRKLLPGMTAFVSIVIEKMENVVRIPSTALQYKPNALVRQYIPKTKLDISMTQGIVYRYANGLLVPVVFEKGISDVYYMQVVNGLNKGDEIVTEFIEKPKR